MWSFCVTFLLAAPCWPQWICLTFAWDGDDEPDEQALTFCALQVQSIQEMFAFLFPYVNSPPCNAEFAKLYAKKQLSLWNY